jgi:hypothetical protein
VVCSSAGLAKHTLGKSGERTFSLPNRPPLILLFLEESSVVFARIGFLVRRAIAIRPLRFATRDGASVHCGNQSFNRRESTR